MKSISPIKRTFHICITLLLLAASLLILTSHQLFAAIIPGSLKGIETDIQLEIQQHKFDTSFSEPLLVTSLFSSCKATCPVNVSQLRLIKQKYQGELNYLFIALHPETDSVETLTDYLSEFAPNMQLKMSADNQAVKQLMGIFPERYSSNDINTHHAGYIYLFHPKAKGLIIYRTPNSQHIIDDLLVLQSRGN